MAWSIAIAMATTVATLACGGATHNFDFAMRFITAHSHCVKQMEEEEEKRQHTNASCRTFTKPLRSSHTLTQLELIQHTRTHTHAHTHSVQLNFDQIEAKINTINKYYVRLLIQAERTRFVLAFHSLNQMRYVIDGRVLNNLHMVYAA